MTVPRGEGVAGRQFPFLFGRYRIVKRLGQGGMGSVYLAENTELGDRPEALKVPEVSDLKRFQREAAATGRLKHANICTIHDYGTIDGNPYLTMELFEQSLADYLKETGFLPQDQAAALVLDLAKAMEHAHEKRIIHRDLKPSNIMLEQVGYALRPVIVDFGLARRDDPELSVLSVSGQLIGTVAYMAPEQALGDRDSVGPVSDVYALGVVLYELLTGRLPYLGSTHQILAQLLRAQTPPSPSDVRRDLDPRLEAICLKAMDKEMGKGKRYPTMRALAEALRLFLQVPPPEPALAPPPVPGQKTDGPTETLLLGPSKQVRNSLGMTLVRIEPGEFLMGGNKYDREKPPHKVCITKAFYLGAHAVTQKQYQEVMGVNPSYFKGSDDLPVESVSWYDAVSFCNQLSARENRRPCYQIDGKTVILLEGTGYRLATEGEWEYACRAGSILDYPFGDDASALGEYAWFSANSGRKTHAVGQKTVNAWGLYHMLGNVWEWCQDVYDEDYYQKSPQDDPPGAPGAGSRVCRGGSWDCGPENCRPAFRDASPPENWDDYLGFRVAAARSSRSGMAE